MHELLISVCESVYFFLARYKESINVSAGCHMNGKEGRAPFYTKIQKKTQQWSMAHK